MKSLLIMIFLFVAAIGKAQIEVLPKKSTYQTKDQRMVVMDDRSFASFHYSREQYDSLKILVKEYDALLVLKDSISEAMKEDFSMLLKKKDEQINSHHTSYDQAKFLLETHAVDYAKLEKRYKRKQRWNNVFKASTAVLAVTTGILILVAK